MVRMHQRVLFREVRPLTADLERLEQRVLELRRAVGLGQVTGVLAHELNNLLWVIGNYTTFVEDEVTRATDEDPARWGPVREDLAQVREAVRRAAALCTRLGDLRSRDGVRARELDLNAVVRDAEGLLRRAAGESVEVVVSPAPDAWPVLADPGVVEHVLVEAVVNARAAMPEGGTVTVSTRNIPKEEAGAGWIGGQVRLEVSDTGTGLVADEAERTFEPFFTTRPGHAGLGLAIVRGLLAETRGQAGIEARAGGGTTFVALFPVAEVE
jgi:two-component system cell cycle sensor histidine kinase/response regulator CckA